MECRSAAAQRGAVEDGTGAVRAESIRGIGASQLLEVRSESDPAPLAAKEGDAGRRIRVIPLPVPEHDSRDAGCG